MYSSKDELLAVMSRNSWFGALPLAERKAMLAVADRVSMGPGEML